MGADLPTDLPTDGSVASKSSHGNFASDVAMLDENMLYVWEEGGGRRGKGHNNGCEHRNDREERRTGG